MFTVGRMAMEKSWSRQIEMESPCQVGSELEAANWSAINKAAQSVHTMTVIPGSREERKRRTWDEDGNGERECRHEEPGKDSVIRRGVPRSGQKPHY